MICHKSRRCTKSAIHIHTENFCVSFSRSTSPAKLSYSWFTHRALGTFMTDAPGCNREEAVPISTNCSEHGTGCLPTTHPYHFDSLARHPGDEKMPTTLGGKPPRRPRIGASRADNARSLARSLGRGALSLCPVDSGCLKPSSVVADSFAPLAGSPPRLAPPPQLTCPIVPCS